MMNLYTVIRDTERDVRRMERDLDAKVAASAQAINEVSCIPLPDYTLELIGLNTTCRPALAASRPLGVTTCNTLVARPRSVMRSMQRG